MVASLVKRNNNCSYIEACSKEYHRMTHSHGCCSATSSLTRLWVAHRPCVGLRGFVMHNVFCHHNTLYD